MSVEYVAHSSDKGSISNEEMEARVREVYAMFDTQRRQIEAQQADADDLKMLEDLERSLIENKE